MSMSKVLTIDEVTAVAQNLTQYESLVVREPNENSFMEPRLMIRNFATSTEPPDYTLVGFISKQTWEKAVQLQLVAGPPRVTIDGRNLQEWIEFAKRDDCLDYMVPSTLRQLLGQIPGRDFRRKY